MKLIATAVALSSLSAAFFLAAYLLHPDGDMLFPEYSPP